MPFKTINPDLLTEQTVQQESAIQGRSTEHLALKDSEVMALFSDNIDKPLPKGVKKGKRISCERLG